MQGNIQSFEWGQIEWIYEPDFNKSLNTMSIGITTIFPNRRQNKHMHYGNEQVIYVLSGEGFQTIGDKTGKMKPGDIYHMDAGIIHETINLSDEPIRQLLVCIPVHYEQNVQIGKKELALIKEVGEVDGKVKISNEIDYIYEAIVNPLKIPVTIFDIDGNIIIQGRNYSEFCKHKCLIDQDVNNCPMYKIKDEYGPPHYADLSAFICPYGLTIFDIPIIFNNRVIGIIKGGHIRTSNDYNIKRVTSSHTLEELIPVVPKGTQNAVMQQFKRLSKTIENYYVLKDAEIELGKKEDIIQDIVKNETILEESLKSTEERVLNIQISNHFLFNTLNSLAGLAVKGDSLKVYQSIIDLSKLLRYTTGDQNHFVQFETEMEHLKNYLNIKKLSYGNKLEVNFDISEDINNKNIPFNCLQPIVENSFVHGFKDMKRDMKIEIGGRTDRGKIIIRIIDNGAGIDEEHLNELKDKIKANNKYGKISGLMMVYSKLKFLYEDKFEFVIESTPKRGTYVKMVLPEYIS